MINKNINTEIQVLNDEMKVWRHYFHAHPETAFEETNTTAFIIDKLREFGVDELYTEFAPTGVVAVIKGNKPGKWIGLRADIDALDILETNDISYCSTIAGKMHACGHDGHATMLLGTAKYLAKHRDFAGNVLLIFQPAEENEGGGRVMVDNGLFARFPVESVYGMHNQPNMTEGQFFICNGAIMASYDVFEITLTGTGSHAAAPHLGRDTIVTAAHLVTALQTIASRNVDPLAQVVVSVTQIHSGDTWNVLPQQAVIRGTVRTFNDKVQDLAEKRIGDISRNIASAFECQVNVHYQRRYPATVNHPNETKLAIAAASAIVGVDNVITNVEPAMGAEDFAFMLRARPGAYIWLGAGNGANLHNPAYNFNDEVLTTGVAYFVEMVHQVLGD